MGAVPIWHFFANHHSQELYLVGEVLKGAATCHVMLISETSGVE